MKSRQLLWIVFLLLFSPANLLSEPPKPDKQDHAWKKLFDGTTLQGWKVTNFGGEGDVWVDDGEIHMDFGGSMTGITYAEKPPTTNYELELEAKRVDGIDFFCTTTFPVEESFCSLVIGGWAGSVVGLSSIDGDDASANDTTRYLKFDEGRWYRIRIRVTPEKIQAWIDDRPVVDQDIEGHQFSTRAEVELSQPLGICAYETRSALRQIRIRDLKKAAPKP